MFLIIFFNLTFYIFFFYKLNSFESINVVLIFSEPSLIWLKLVNLICNLQEIAYRKYMRAKEIITPHEFTFTFNSDLFLFCNLIIYLILVDYSHFEFLFQLIVFHFELGISINKNIIEIEY